MAASTFQSHAKPSLSLGETVHILYTLVDSMRVKYQTQLATTLFPPSATDPPASVQISIKPLKRILEFASVKQLQFGSPSSRETYRSCLKKHGLEEDIEELGKDEEGEDKGAIMWVGGRWNQGDQKKVLFHCHGGGFVAPMGPGHAEMMRWMVEDGKGKLCAAMLEYSLAPGKVFPTPLKQAAAALQHIIDQGCSPENIILSGDSAGGNMIVGVLSHLLHPHPSVPALRLPPNQRFPAALLISPWVSFNIKTNSFTTNGPYDYITASFIEGWAHTAMGSPTAHETEKAAGRYHAEALYAPEDWWKGLGEKVTFVGVLAGGKEALMDTVLEFGEKLDKALKEEDVKLERFTGVRDVHDTPLIELGENIEKGDVTKMWGEWVLREAGVRN